MGSIGTLKKSHKPFETGKRMKMVKQATTKKSFLTCSGSEIFIVVTKNERDYDYLEQTPLNRSQQLPAPYKRLIDEIKQNELRENDWRTDNSDLKIPRYRCTRTGSVPIHVKCSCA